MGDTPVGQVSFSGGALVPQARRMQAPAPAARCESRTLPLRIPHPCARARAARPADGAELGDGMAVA